MCGRQLWHARVAICTVLTDTRTHAPKAEKVSFLFLKPFYLKTKTKNQNPNQNISHWRLFFFIFLKILLHKYLPFPRVRGRMSLL